MFIPKECNNRLLQSFDWERPVIQVMSIIEVYMNMCKKAKSFASVRFLASAYLFHYVIVKLKYNECIL